MYILPAYPADIEALDQAATKVVSGHHSQKASSLYRTLQNDLVKNLELGKTTIIVVGDHDESNIIPKLLSNHKLSKLTLSIDNKTPLSDKIHAQFKVLSKSSKSRYNPKNYELTKSLVHQKKQKLNLSYSLLNRPIFGNRSWQYIATNNNFFSYHDEVCLLKQKLDFQNFQFDQKEYWLMRGRIEEAKTLFQPEFNFIAKSDQLNIKLIIHKGAESVRETLMSFARECKKLNFLFSGFIDDVALQYYRKGLKEIEEIASLVNQLAKKLHEHELRYGSQFEQPMSNLQEKWKGRFSGQFKSKIASKKNLRKLTHQLTENFRNSQKFHIEIQAVPEEDINFSYIKEVLGLAEDSIHFWRDSVSKYKDFSLKQINLLNSEMKELKILDQKFQSLIDRVNDAGVFVETLEDNTFNVLKKTEFLSSIQHDIEQAIWLINTQNEYLNWQITKDKYPIEVVHMLNGLENFPTKRWTVLFDRYYIEEITNQHFQPAMPRSFAVIERYLAQLDTYRAETIHWIEHRWEKKRQQETETLFQNNKNLHTQLLKKTKPISSSSLELLKDNPAFMTAYFPIMIVKESDMAALKAWNGKEWDFCWLLKTHAEKSLFKVLPKSMYHKLIIVQNDLDADNLSNQIATNFKLTEFQFHPLKIEYKEVVTPFSLMQKSEILNNAKNLAAKLSFAEHKLRIFQLKEKSIISFLSDMNNEKLYQMLDGLGIKELIPRHETDYRLLDVLIDTDKELILFTQDGLLDSDIPETVEWQYLMLQQLKQLGVNWVNLWTTDYYFEGGEVLKKLLVKCIPEILNNSILTENQVTA